MSINRKKREFRVKLRNDITKDVNDVVADALAVESEKVNDKTRLGYFDAMAVTFDLHKKYPDIKFPEDKFDKFCRVSTLRNYIFMKMCPVNKKHK